MKNKLKKCGHFIRTEKTLKINSYAEILIKKSDLGEVWHIDISTEKGDNQTYLFECCNSIVYSITYDRKSCDSFRVICPICKKKLNAFVRL